MSYGSVDVPLRAEQSRMHRPELDREAIENALLVARKRADACSPGGPSWDAAMGLVDELEQAVRRLEQPADLTPIRQLSTTSSSR
jgi:hypothetical protein